MKHTAFSLLALMVCVGLSGCNTPPKMDSDKTIFDHLQEEVGKITEEGGMAAVGIGESSNTPLALTRAKMEARKNLAQLVEVKIEDLEKSFIEEIGQAGSSEVNQLFSSASKQITSQKLQGTSPLVQKYETKDGKTTAYVLMVLNPDIIDESLKDNGAKHLYERFRASKAFEELDKEIKEFEAAERDSIPAL